MKDKGWSHVLVHYAWIRLPLVARRLSGKLTRALVDGHYLTAWPPAAAVLPPIALLAGLFIGWQHWGFTVVFSESMVVMIGAAVLGILSGHLGVLFVVGFALGDFFLSDTPWSPFLQVRLPQVIEYSLLGLLTAMTPVLTKTLLVQLTPPDAIPRPVRFGFAVLGHVALTCAIVYLWIQIVPVLIRPVFTWQGSAPTNVAVAPLQHSGMALVVAAGCASLVRMALQGMTAFQGVYGERLDALEAELAAAEPVQPLVDRLPALARIAGRTLWALLLLAGMLQFWLDALLLAGIIMVLQVARERLVPVPLGPWPRFIERVPLLFRFLVGFAIIYFISDAVLAAQLRATNTFRPIVILVGLSLVLFFLLAPGLPRTDPSKAGREAA